MQRQIGSSDFDVALFDETGLHDFLSVFVHG
jgi:hypothetical protein